MSLFEFCLEIIRRESNKFNVGVNTAVASQITAATASNVNFDNAHNRCAFLYRCGAINLSLARDCFKKFLSDERSKFLFLESSNLTVCSISKGPALDYIALLLAYQECNSFPLKFNSIKLISKYGAWRNTANIMLEVLKEGYLTSLSPLMSFGDIEVIQGDPFLQFTEKVKQPIGNSDIILMVKTLNLKDDGFGQVYAKSLQEFLDSLKPGATIFCIDTKPSVAVISHQLSSFAGNYLCEPIHMNTVISLEHVEFYKEIFGCFPVISARGSFFVWQKSLFLSSTLDSLLGEVKESLRSQPVANEIQNNTYSNKICESVYNKLFESKQQITSTPTNVCNLSENFKCSNIDPLLGNDIMDRNLEKFSVPSLSQNNIAVQDNVKESGELCKKQLNISTVVNRAVQTEPGDLKGVELSGMMELNNKIVELTSALGEMLQLEEHKNGNCLDDCPHNLTSSITSCLHSCQCKKPLEFFCRTCGCNRELQHHPSEQFTSNWHGSLNDLNKTSFNSTGNSSSTPKLVIPLKSLPANALSQILSIITQLYQEQQ